MKEILEAVLNDPALRDDDEDRLLADAPSSYLGWI